MKNYIKQLKDGEQFSAQSWLSESGKAQLVRYESLHMAMSDVDHNRANGTWQCSDCSNESSSFSFGSDYPNLSVSHAALDTFSIKDEILSRVDKMKTDLLYKYPELRNLNRSAHGMKRRRVFRETGDELDIDRYMCGDPNQWSTRPKSPVKNTVRILFNNVIMGADDANTVLSNSVKMAAIMDLFSMAGISTELYGCDMCKYSDRYSKHVEYPLVMYKVKNATEPLDIQSILCTGIPAVFRWYMFYLTQNTIDGMMHQGGGCAIRELNPDITDMLKFANIDLCVFGKVLNDDFSSVIGDVKKALHLDEDSI